MKLDSSGGQIGHGYHAAIKQLEVAHPQAPNVRSPGLKDGFGDVFNAAPQDRVGVAPVMLRETRYLRNLEA